MVVSDLLMTTPPHTPPPCASAAATSDYSSGASCPVGLVCNQLQVTTLDGSGEQQCVYFCRASSVSIVTLYVHGLAFTTIPYL